MRGQREAWRIGRGARKGEERHWGRVKDSSGGVRWTKCEKRQVELKKKKKMKYRGDNKLV